MNEISIRPATIEDAAHIHNLLGELEKTLGATSKVKRTVDDLKRFGFSGTPCFEALIAWRGAEAVGLALYFREFSSWLGTPGVYVQDLYVCPTLRGSGLGSKLMQSVYDQTRSWDAAYCKLTVHSDNEPALAFYSQLGFQAVDDDCVLFLTLE
ncbi:MAG: GNAT family N-acetyltransferase [Lysobacterales bacterium]